MFQAARQSGRKQRALLKRYVWGRQTIEQLAQEPERSHVWVKKQLDAALERTRTIAPQPTPVTADMTFWGRGYGVLVFRSPTLKKNLWWTESLFETPFVYREGLVALRKQDWTVTSVVIDGKRGVAQVFERLGIPVQYCQFHQVKTVTKYLTRKPKTEAARELRALALWLKDTREHECKIALN